MHAYTRTTDGFVTSMHDRAPVAARHRLTIVNPGSNNAQMSHLRVVNLGAATAMATVTGVDDAGESPGSFR